MPEREFYRWQVRSFTVRLNLDVVEKLAHQLFLSSLNPQEEHGGLLLGRVIDLNHVDVTGFEFIRSRHHRGAAYDLGGSERNSVARYVQTYDKRSGAKPVGYFRTHLRPGLFLDQSDFELMQETFSSRTGIALAIRPEEIGSPKAGIFFWEDGDLDRSQTALMFPFDAQQLRLQGPLDREQPPQTMVSRAKSRMNREWFTQANATSLGKRAASPALGVLGGLAAGIVAFAALSALHQSSPVRKTSIGSAPSQPSNTKTIQAPPEHDPPALQAPPPAFDDDLQRETAATSRESDDSEPPPTFVRSPFATPETRKSETARVDVDKIPPPIAPTPTTPPAALQGNTTSAALPPAPPEQAFAPIPAPRPLSVEVDVQPKEASVFKRMAGTVPAVAGHVPLLGKLRPFHHDDHNHLVAARPTAGLEPQIPMSMSRGVHDEVDVEIEASIDDHGRVRNTEITRGTQTALDTIAENKVRSVPWKPARAGDHNVPMDVVVHYRFNPNRE